MRHHHKQIDVAAWIGLTAGLRAKEVNALGMKASRQTVHYITDKRRDDGYFAHLSIDYILD